LSYPFAGLDSKEKLRYRIVSDPQNEAFEREVEFLEEQLTKAEERINDYLFAPTHTVSAESLRGENMLIHLYRVHKVSQLLEKQISPREL
jgi:hypothetical protein